MRKAFHYNGLSIVLLFLFLTFWGCQAGTGWHVYNESRHLAGRSVIAFLPYLQSGHFWQATGENWESEFLQMGFYIVLTIFLYQKGSAESKDPDDNQNMDNKRKELNIHWLYQNSLSLMFLVLFALSFVIHATGGAIENNFNRVQMGLEPQTIMEFLAGAQFWFQSFQNWQSEFLSVLAIVTLTIFLRQKGSPESKAVTDLNSKTGS